MELYGKVTERKSAGEYYLSIYILFISWLKNLFQKEREKNINSFKIISLINYLILFFQ